MTAMNTLPRSQTGRRPALRVCCAWCEQSLDPAPPEPLAETSHGICAPCAWRYFGMEIRPVPAGEARPE
jgi:hypothetical protein